MAVPIEAIPPATESRAAWIGRKAKPMPLWTSRTSGLPEKAMSTSVTRPRTEAKPKTERPKVYKVILLNDDYTPREFVVVVLRAVFRMTTDQALGVMLTAHKRGVCVVAVYTREIAETKATQATDMAAREGYPLMFTTEPEE